MLCTITSVPFFAKEPRAGFFINVHHQSPGTQASIALWLSNDKSIQAIQYNSSDALKQFLYNNILKLVYFNINHNNKLIIRYHRIVKN